MSELPQGLLTAASVGLGLSVLESLVTLQIARMREDEHELDKYCLWLANSCGVDPITAKRRFTNYVQTVPHSWHDCRAVGPKIVQSADYD